MLTGVYCYIFVGPNSCVGSVKNVGTHGFVGRINCEGQYIGVAASAERNGDCTKWQNLLTNNLRGVTVGKDFYGGYTKEQLSLVITVISKHELLFIKKAVEEVDKDAFVNVQPTVDVIGNFLDKSLLE